MAVPSSGELSLRGIRRELETNNYDHTDTYSDISLTNCSDGTVETINTNNASANRPDTSTPHLMSEFYAYDHDFSSTDTQFNTSISDFDLSEGTGGTEYSDNKTMIINNGSGDVDADITSVAPNTGNLFVAMSGAGDPGTSGTANNGTGWVQEGTQATLDEEDLPVGWDASGTTINVRFKFVAHSAAAAQDDRTITFTVNSVTDTLTVGVTTTGK